MSWFTNLSLVSPSIPTTRRSVWLHSHPVGVDIFPGELDGVGRPLLHQHPRLEVFNLREVMARLSLVLAGVLDHPIHVHTEAVEGVGEAAARVFFGRGII